MPQSALAGLVVVVVVAAAFGVVQRRKARLVSGQSSAKSPHDRCIPQTAYNPIAFSYIPIIIRLMDGFTSLFPLIRPPFAAFPPGFGRMRYAFVYLL